MFQCERCGSRYSPVHAAATENCPRCQVRDRVSNPLTMARLEPTGRQEAEALPEELGSRPDAGPAPSPPTIV
jgi:predicted  nucleic acid-binding Zn-ribbon protein